MSLACCMGLDGLSRRCWLLAGWPVYGGRRRTSSSDVTHPRVRALTPSRYAPEKIPYGIKRYQEETQRLYTVLEDGLNAGKGEWLVGDKYSVADINGE